MPASFTPILLQLAVLALLAGVFWLVVVRVISRERALRKSPFTQKLQNSPGQSSARKLDDLGDDLWEAFAMIFIGFAFISGFGFALLSPPLKSPYVLFSLCFLIIVFCIWQMLRLRRTMRERANYQLGLEGERHTAQALLPLLAEGYELFHDLEFQDATGKPFNIDHVLLGPAGVIVIETKTRSKEADGKGPDSAKVRYDGKQLLYPKGHETHGLSQILANAKFLSKELTAHTGEKVFVTPAVSLPGWYVTQTAKDVNPIVHNPEMLRSWVRDLRAAPMDTPQRNRIRGFLARVN
jgi:hypothetical protein